VTSFDVGLLAVAGLMGGAANAVAGGGTFFTFPAMVATGLSTLSANATSAIGLVPGCVAIAAAYRKETVASWRSGLLYGIAGIIRGMAGALLLIRLGDEGFRPLVPWLLGLATLTFALGERIQGLSLRLAHGRRPNAAVRFFIILVIGIYGGFFGAGLGIMALAALTVIEPPDYHRSNAIKNLIAAGSQSTASVLFVVGGLVDWRAAIITIAAAICAGYFGVSIARRVPQAIVRAVIVAIGVTLTVFFFMR
jgi:uncharacterized membrane protein YfcA